MSEQKEQPVPKCPCGTCDTDDGYADWSEECLKWLREEKS